jgi:hypothetical protein
MRAVKVFYIIAAPALGAFGMAFLRKITRTE